MTSPDGIHHLKLPVTDLDRSIRWYTEVLGARRLAARDHRRPDGTLFAVILDIPGLGTYLELRLDPDTARALRQYDFITLAVADLAALDRWLAHLDELGVDHSPKIVAIEGWLLIAVDPDGLRLRFYTTQHHGLDATQIDFGSSWLSADVAESTVRRAVGKIRALPDHEDELLGLLRTLAPVTREEAGCLAFEVFQILDEPGSFAIHERWATPAAMNAHHQTEHAAAFLKEAGALLDGPPELDLLTPID